MSYHTRFNREENVRKLSWKLTCDQVLLCIHVGWSEAADEHLHVTKTCESSQESMNYIEEEQLSTPLLRVHKHLTFDTQLVSCSLCTQFRIVVLFLAQCVSVVPILSTHSSYRKRHHQLMMLLLTANDGPLCHIMLHPGNLHIPGTTVVATVACFAAARRTHPIIQLC